jgi:hypothetical protein
VDPPADPFRFFDGIFCLNLDVEEKRWAQAVRRHEQLGIDGRVERVSAVWTPENHHIGCALSWRSMIDLAQRRN